MKTEPFHACPRYDRCSVNRCPLDPAMPERETVAADEHCTLPKARRMSLAAAHLAVLPWRGLWPRELASLRAWEALPVAEREVRSAARRAQMAALNAARKGTQPALHRDSEGVAPSGYQTTGAP